MAIRFIRGAGLGGGGEARPFREGVKRGLMANNIQLSSAHDNSILFGVRAQSLLYGPPPENRGYAPDMSPRFGVHLTGLRKAAGLSQNQLAVKLGVTQSNISFWEQWDKPPRGEVLPKLAEVLGVGMDELMNFKAPRPKAGPKGKVGEAFEAVSRLPRRQQEHVLKVVHALVAQSAAENGASS
jgi:transcriptional regulator with XRE-family HTH domain